MTANLRTVRWIVALTLALVANPHWGPTAGAGPISEMLARHRQARQMKLPAMRKPFDSRPVKDLNTHTASLSQRFKKRFSLRRGGAEGVIPMNQDEGVVKTSR